MIAGSPITLHLSEHEADILQHALSTWNGPYMDNQSESLTLPEKQRAGEQVSEARNMCETIRAELMRRYENDLASKHRQDHDRYGEVDLLHEYLPGGIHS